MSNALLGQSVPPGGAPPAGSGNIDHQAFVRVIDGETVEIRVAGRLVGIGLIGIDAPMGNTPCGKESSALLASLVRAGLHADEDTALTFDERGRRLYYALTRARQSISLQLVSSGLARANRRGKETGHLIAAEAHARKERRGCLWNDGDKRPKANADLSDPEAPVVLETAAVAPEASEASPLAAALPPNFTIEPIEAVNSWLANPTAFAWLPDGRILVTQKHGEVRLIKNGLLQDAPALDLSSRVNDYWDRGLLSIAVDPDFATTGHIYLLYTYENDPTTWNGTKTGRLARYTMTGDTISIGSEVVILGKSVGTSCDLFPAGADCIPSDSPSHTVGTLKFAPDKNLFVSLGDGAHFNYVDDRALRTQNKDSLAGKLVRISRSGQGVVGNPFVNEAGGDLNSNRAKVWAYGFRNSYRFGLHPTTSVPYIGDVGWMTWEEINVGSFGANLGWPCYEGAAIQSGYQPKSVCQSLYNAGPGAVKMPLVTYNHNGAGAAVTAGAFYTGTSYPTQFRGAFFYGDYSLSNIWYIQTNSSDVLTAGPVTFITGAEGPVDIEMGPDGSLYYLAISAGQLRRIRYIGSTGPPNAVISANPTSGLVPLTVQFSSSGSSDPDGGALTYLWNFGDGTAFATNANPTHVYQSTGSYIAQLTVTDPEGKTNSKTVTINVNPNTPPVPAIASPASTLTYKVGDIISFSGSAIDQEDGTLPASALSWQVITHHCPGGVCHTHFYSSANGVSAGSFPADDHGDDSYFEIILTARDAKGLIGTKSVLIQPRTVELTFATAPAGFRIVYNGTQFTTPWKRRVIVGGTRSISAPTTWGAYVFSSWSDGGPASHNIQVGATNSTYTASYSRVAAPSNLRATAVFSNRTRLDWTDNSSNETLFHIEHSRDGTTFKQIAAVGTNVTTFTFTLPDMTGGTTHHYRVRASHKGIAFSPYSNRATVTMPSN